jgi:hypothetical protein
MSDANTTELLMMPETTVGTIPSTNTYIETTAGPIYVWRREYNWNKFRTLGSTISPQNRVLQSREIRSTRNPPGAKLGTPGAGGTLPFELHMDPTVLGAAIAASMQNDGFDGAGSVSPPVTTTGVSVLDADYSGALVATAVSLGYIPASYDLLCGVAKKAGWTPLTESGGDADYMAGDVVRFYRYSGSTVQNDEFRRIVYVTNNDGSGNGVLIYYGPQLEEHNDWRVERGFRSKNGVLSRSYSVLERNKSPGQATYDRYETFRGLGINSFSLNVTLDQITTGEFGFVGTGSDGITEVPPNHSNPIAANDGKYSGTSAGDGTPIGEIGTAGTYYSDFSASYSTAEVMDSLNNVPSVIVAGVEYPVQSVQFQWENGMRPRGVVGQREPTGVGSGQFRGSGTVTCYYDDIAEYNKALEGTLSDLMVVCRDQQNEFGNYFAFSFPAIRWGNPTRTGKTQDEQIIVNLPFTIETSSITNEECGVVMMMGLTINI